jgi:hypothetical protein
MQRARDQPSLKGQAHRRVHMGTNQPATCVSAAEVYQAYGPIFTIYTRLSAMRAASNHGISASANTYSYATLVTSSRISNSIRGSA